MQSLVLPEARGIRRDDVEVPHEVPILAERGAVIVPEDPFHRGGKPLHVALGEPRSLLEFLRESGDGHSELAEVLHGAGLAHRPANGGGAMNLLTESRYQGRPIARARKPFSGSIPLLAPMKSSRNPGDVTCRSLNR